MTTSMTTSETTDSTAAPPPPGAFRWRLGHRPDVRFGHAAGGVAGILAAAAVLAFVVEVTDDDATLPGVGFNLALMAVALAVGSRVRGPVRSAAVAAIVVAVPQVWAFAIAGDGEGIEFGDFRAILLLSVASYALLYALTWTRGRAVLLGFALLFLVNWIVFEVADRPAPLAFDVAEQIQEQGLRDRDGVLGDRDDSTTETAIVEIGLAIVLLGAGVALDRRHLAGAATPFLLVGALMAVTGAITLGIDVEDEYAAGVFVALAGAGTGLAGSLGRRRATSWIGAVVLLLGVLTLVIQGTADAVSGDGAAAVFGAFALLGAAVLVVIGVLVARALDEPVDGGEPLPSRPPEPTGAAPTPVEPPESELPAAPAPGAPPGEPEPPA